MTWWMWIIYLIAVIYIAGFFFVLFFHMYYLQMITFELALLRSFVWPIYFATGGRWPHGVHIPMD